MERWQARQIGSRRTASTWWSRGEFSQLVHMQTISGNEHPYHYLQSSNIIMFVWVPDDRFHMDSVTKIPLKIENHLYIHTENTNNNHWYLKKIQKIQAIIYMFKLIWRTWKRWQPVTSWGEERAWALRTESHTTIVAATRLADDQRRAHED